MSSGYKKFLLLWIAGFISASGSGMTSFALGIFMYQKTGMSSMTGLIILAGFLPGLILSPISGALADRYDRRLLMMLGDGLSIIGLIAISISLNYFEDTFLIIFILLGAAISSSFSSLVEPSFRATISDLLIKDEYSKASGMLQLIPASRYLLSPILSGLILSIADINAIIIIDILTIIITLPITYIVRKEMKKRYNTINTGLGEDMKLGFHIIYNKKGIWLLVMLGVIVSFCLGTVQTLMIPMILSFSDESFLGVSTTISAMGILAGGIFLSKVKIKNSFTHILQASVFFMGIFMIAFAIRENKFFICLFGFSLFLTLPFANTAMDYLVRINVSYTHQGKVWGAIGLISQIGYIIAYAFIGMINDFFVTPYIISSNRIRQLIIFMVGRGEERGAALIITLVGTLLIFTAISLSKKIEIKKLEVEDVLDLA